MITTQMYSQVGINTEVPNKLTDLDITNLVNTNGDTIPKGIMIPRMSEKQRNKMDVSVPNTANSVLIYNTDEDCYNYYSKTNKEWQSLCGKLGKAEFTLDCNSVEVGGKGTYFSGKPLTPSHYLKATVTVTKPGSYNITAMPDPANGYYFTLSGEFLSKGEYTIIIPGAGTPIKPSPDQDNLDTGDNVKFTLNGIDGQCSTIIHIIDSTVKPKFSMSCGTARPSGIYKIGVPLTGSNFITITIIGDVSGGTGAKAVLQTNEVDGIKFISNPVEIIGGMQVITLYGVGTPQSSGTKIFTITSNSTSSSATCNASLNVVMKPKRILSIGLYNGYGYSFGQPGTMPGPYALVHDARNFGTLNTSVVQIEKLEVIGFNSIVPLTVSMMQQYVSGPNKVDMIIIAFSAGWYAAEDGVATLLGNYVKNGNPLFLMGDNNMSYGQTPSISWTRIMQAIFEGTTNNVKVQNLDPGTPGQIFRLSSINHPILNGPFGDIRGQYWGEDSSIAQVVLNLPNDEIVLFSDCWDISINGYVPNPAQQNGITGFAHRKYPFVFIGDGGFDSRELSNNFRPDACPFLLDSQNFPTTRHNYGRAGAANPRFSVSNAIFVANAIAWGLNIVEGIIKQ